MSRGRGVALLASLLVGCGPTVEVGDDDANGDTSSGVASTTGPTAESATDEGPATTTASTTGTDDGSLDGYEDDDGGTGCTFTCPDPPPPPPPPGQGNPGGQCSLEAQDCPEGEKCMPWANDGGTEWNATRCSPIDDDPGGVDETCTVEGSGYSGIDSCDIGLMCFGVDPRTNVGTCASLCNLDQVVCEPPDDVCAVFGAVSVCVQSCDPVAPSPCPAGQACFVTGTGFYCEGVAEMPLGPGEPCPGPYTCDIGLLCAYGPGIECGGEAGEGCCAAVCDATDPGSCPGGPAVTCEPWFAVDPPPQWAHVGVCVPP